MRCTLLLIAILTGCGSTVELDEQWRPLRYMTESKTLAVGANARTIGETMFVRDLEEWETRHPYPLDAGVYTHERVHTIQQQDYPDGIWKWIARYLTDTGFMWRAEQDAHYAHIQFLRQHGVAIVVDSWAEKLASYWNTVGRMVTEQDAAEWLRSVLDGSWTPEVEREDPR